MIGDVNTVIWKEWKEILFQRGNLRGGMIGLLLVVGVFGVFLPLQMGARWIESPVSLLFWAWVPVFLVVSVVADSFAGERERHTLEALLATPLSDRAILFGKIGAGVSYGWGLTLVSLLLGLITVNLAYGAGRLLLYPASIGLTILALSFLAALLAAGAGVLVSLKAPTVRQAQQSLSIAIMLLLFVPVFGVQALPDEWKARIVRMLTGATISKIVVAALCILIVVDLVLLVAAMARFRRARLILD